MAEFIALIIKQHWIIQFEIKSRGIIIWDTKLLCLSFCFVTIQYKSLQSIQNINICQLYLSDFKMSVAKIIKEGTIALSKIVPCGCGPSKKSNISLMSMMARYVKEERNVVKFINPQSQVLSNCPQNSSGDVSIFQHQKSDLLKLDENIQKCLQNVSSDQRNDIIQVNEFDEKSCNMKQSSKTPLETEPIIYL